MARKGIEYKMAKCGLTTLSKCKRMKANLKECDGCKLVTRVADRWKVVDGKKYKKCGCCGNFLPVDMFYPKRIKKPDGRLCDSTEGLCKICRSVQGKEAYKRKVLGLK